MLGRIKKCRSESKASDFVYTARTAPEQSPLCFGAFLCPDKTNCAHPGNVKLDKAGAPARKTSHSLNPVPCIVFDPESKNEYKPELREGLGISSLAATCIELLGYEPPADYDPSVLVFK